MSGPRCAPSDAAPPDVLLSGYLRKLKTFRRRFFVLRADSPENSARLEYYDSERKFQAGGAPKRSIPIKSCFNINKKGDTKHRNVIALFTKDDCFCVVLDGDKEAEEWLRCLLKLQHGEEAPDGEEPRPTFEHVWQVTVANRGLGNAGLTGYYRLCLTDKTLSLIKIDCDVPQIQFNLSNIRSCGSLRDFFFLEVGRSSTLGAGELWMQTGDSNIADNVHAIVFHAMTTNSGATSSSREELGPKSRIRSCSATESSKPNMTKKPNVIQPSKGYNLPQGSTTGGNAQGRDRCDSMPSSRVRTTSEGASHIWPNNPRFHLNPMNATTAYHRPISLYTRESPPMGSPISPPSCSTDSAGSSYSLPDDTTVTDYCPLSSIINAPPPPPPYAPDEPIQEEDFVPDSPSPYVSMATPQASSNHDGYMSMATPTNHHEGYVDMSPKTGGGRFLHHAYYQQHPTTSSPTASMSSVTSGTPSTDIRFSEYPLEKVSSYLSADDDDTRPTRAYSVGSRPESYINRGDNLRVRALSVGSKAKRPPGRVLPPSSHHPNHKSSSAPLLSNGRVGQGSSHGSIGPMDDLMEMDFSSRSGSATSGYMDMRPGVGGGGACKQTPHHHGYVEMKPGATPRKPPDPSPYVDMSHGSSPARPNLTDYIVMDPAHRHHDGDYLNMSFAHKSEPPTPEGYVEMSLGHRRQSSLDEDYANMTLGKKQRDRTSRKKERSQPINIHNPSLHLPLREYNSSTLPRQRRRDSSSSSSVTTPSNSSTIFPFSPCTPTANDYTPMDFDRRGGGGDYVNCGSSRLVKVADTPTEPAYEVLRARPASTNSDGTLVGSPGASGEVVQLHYASLNLEEGNRSPRSGDGSLSYAAIDFARSESLKQKVKN